MNPTDTIILAGLANNKTSLGEIFRRYVECFKQFSQPDVYDIGHYIENSEVRKYFFPQFKGKIDHNIRYIHSTFNLYRSLSTHVKPRCRCCNNLSNKKKIGYFVWESSELPESDVEILKEFDEIWTASKYCKDVFSQYINASNIKIINHPIGFPLKSHEKYKKMTILIIGNISSNIDRKNTLENIRVAYVVKQKYPDIDIIFKTFTISDKERELITYIRRNFDISVIDEYYHGLQLQELIAKSHIMFSMHRSEGFGLCLAEGIPFGTIPLATGYSGNLDFMTDTRLLIDYKLVDVKQPYFRGQWAEPNANDAIDKLCSIINNYPNIDYNFDNISNYSFDEVTRMIKNAL